MLLVDIKGTLKAPKTYLVSFLSIASLSKANYVIKQYYIGLISVKILDMSHILLCNVAWT